MVPGRRRRGGRSRPVATPGGPRRLRGRILAAWPGPRECACAACACGGICSPRPASRSRGSGPAPVLVLPRRACAAGACGRFGLDELGLVCGIANTARGSAYSVFGPPRRSYRSGFLSDVRPMPSRTMRGVEYLLNRLLLRPRHRDIGKSKGKLFFLWLLIGRRPADPRLLAVIFYRREKDEPERQCPRCGKALKLYVRSARAAARTSTCPTRRRPPPGRR